MNSIVKALSTLPLLIAAALPLTGCGATSLVLGGGTCTDATKAVAAEIPAYGNAKLELEDGAGGGCFASFTTSDPRTRVFAYYRRQFKSHGWRTRVTGTAPPGASVVGIEGRRHGDFYEISTEPGESTSRTYVAINVSAPDK